MILPTIDKADVKGKRVLVRGDIDVPDGDFFRLEAIKPTISYLLENNCRVVLCGHRGRPRGFDPKLTTKPVQDFFPNVKVLENLRFDPREEANDENFAKELAKDQDIFVNESFAESYREVSSISGVAKLLPRYAGFRLAKEVEVLSKVITDPERPMVVFVGGIKWDTKEEFVQKMKTIADTVVTSKDMPPGLDVKIEEIDKYKAAIETAKTIIWNGPFGKVEDFTYQVGTRRLAELITNNQTTYKVVGGGDTVAFVKKLGLLDKFNWVCSGGGSMLKFFSGEKLPGIEALL